MLAPVVAVGEQASCLELCTQDIVHTCSGDNWLPNYLRTKEDMLQNHNLMRRLMCRAWLLQQPARAARTRSKLCNRNGCMLRPRRLCTPQCKPHSLCHLQMCYCME